LGNGEPLMPEDLREGFDLVIRALRTSGLAWIAEEIEAEVLAGRLVERDIPAGSRSVTREMTTEEYSLEEQLAVALRTLFEYAQISRGIWDSGRTFCSEQLAVNS